MDVTLKEELVLLDVEASDRYELLEKAAKRLYDEGFVKETYKHAVIEREKVFATGLPTLIGGVAIPHTDVEHVERPAICIVRLKSPVDFVIMGDEAETVPVDLIFMLAMKEAHAQITLLQNLMGILQDEEALKLVKTSTETREIVDFVTRRLAKTEA